MTSSRQTITNSVRPVRHHATGHVSSDHRVCSQRRWSAWELARRLLTFLLNYVVPRGPVWLAGDETVAERPGPTSSARDAIAMACARPTAIRRIGGGIRGSSCRYESSFRSRSDPGHSRCWGPCIATPPGIRSMGRAIKRRRLWPDSAWHAWYAGFQRASSSLWGIPGTAPARPHGFVAHTGVTSRWSASVMVMPPGTNLLPRVRVTPWDARV